MVTFSALLAILSWYKQVSMVSCNISAPKGLTLPETKLTKVSDATCNGLMLIIHYCNGIMGAVAFQITSLTIVYSTVHAGADQRKHQNFASLAFVRGIHRWPVNSPHKGPVTRKMLQFDDVIMSLEKYLTTSNRYPPFPVPIYILPTNFQKKSVLRVLFGPLGGRD